METMHRQCSITDMMAYLLFFPQRRAMFILLGKVNAHTEETIVIVYQNKGLKGYYQSLPPPPTPSS